MFNIGGPSTGSSSFSSLVGIGSGMQLEGLEAKTIFINGSRDIVLKNLSVSIYPRSWQSCADSGQLSFGGIRRFKEEFVICFLMIMIFSSKKFMNLLLLKWKPSSLGECCFLVNFATVSKINFRSSLFSSIKLEKLDDRAAVRALRYCRALSFQASRNTSSLVWRHFRSNFLEACFRALFFSVYQGASFLWQIILVFRGPFRVLRKVKLSSSVTDFCPGRASRNICVVWEFIARLLMLLGWGLSRLFVAMQI